MNKHKTFYNTDASFPNTQLPLMKLAALYFDKLVVFGFMVAITATGHNDCFTINE